MTYADAREQCLRRATIALVACWLNIIISVIAIVRGMVVGWNEAFPIISMLCLANAIVDGKLALWLSGEEE